MTFKNFPVNSNIHLLYFIARRLPLFAILRYLVSMTYCMYFVEHLLQKHFSTLLLRYVRYSCFIRKPWLLKQRGIQIWFPLIKSCLKYIITFRWFETTIFVLKYILNSYVITVSILYQKSYETPKVLSKPKQILIRCRTSWIIF